MTTRKFKCKRCGDLFLPYFTTIEEIDKHKRLTVCSSCFDTLNRERAEKNGWLQVIIAVVGFFLSGYLMSINNILTFPVVLLSIFFLINGIHEMNWGPC